MMVNAISSGDDFQRRDLLAFESEEEPKIHGAPGKIAGEPAGDDDLSVLLFAREGFARVLVLGRSLRLPLPDRRPAAVGVPFILHDGLFGEALRKGLSVALIGGEKGGEGVWEIESPGELPLCETRGKMCSRFQ